LGQTSLGYRAPAVEPIPAAFVPAPAAAPIAPVVFTLVFDETNMDGNPLSDGGNISVNFGQDGPHLIHPFQLTGAIGYAGNIAGPELSSNGQPVEVAFTNGSAIGWIGGVGVGTKVFELVLDIQTGRYDFTLYEPLDHSDTTNPDETIDLTFGIVVTDRDGDPAFAALKVTVHDDAPFVGEDQSTVDETALTAATPLVATGNVGPDFGEDGAGTLLPGVFAVGGSYKGTVANPTSLHSNGVKVDVTANADGKGWTGTANGVTVFTLTFDPASGDYVYTQFKALDHLDNTDPNDEIILNFDLNIRDYDGDTDPGKIVIIVRDDAPHFPPPPPPPVGELPKPGEGYSVVDETNLVPGGLVVKDTVVANFGADAPGTYALNNSFTPSYALTSNGDPVTVTINNGVYTGTAGGNEIFTLSINPTTGEYTFTLKGVLDHADATNPNDAIRLTFGVDALDSEGEAASGTIVIDVLDDGPVAVDDGRTVDEGQAITGNVITNDNPGQDLPGKVVSITVNGVTTTLPTDGSNITIDGVYGKLTINNTGSYTYVADATGANRVDNFTYVLRDHDGDTDPATLSIEVKKLNTIPEIIKPAVEVVDETNLPAGVTETGKVDADFKADGPGTFAGTGTFASSGSQLNDALTHKGVPVVVTLIGDTYHGVAGAVPVFTLKIDADGNYTFVLQNTLDHKNAADPDDVIRLEFGVKAVDSNNDEATTVITVDVHDDAPTIGDGAGSVDESNLTATTPLVATGNLVENFGQDGQGAISTTGVFTPGGSFKGTELTSNGVKVNVTNTANGYEGKVGNTVVFTLVIDTATGEYTYTQYKALDHANNNDPNDVLTLNFGVKITDRDGDTDNGNIIIEVADDAPRFPPPPPPPGGGQPKPGDGYNIVDETNLVPGGLVVKDTVVANFGADAPGTYALNNSFTPSYALTSNGAPVTVTLDNGVFKGVANGNEIFTLSINPTTGEYTFTLKGVLDHADATNPNDVIRLTFGVDARDSEGEAASGTIVIDVLDDGPAITGATNLVREQDLGPVSVTGNLGGDFNNDGPGAIDTTGSFIAQGSVKGPALASDGVPVLVNSTATGYTGTANGQPVFTLTINPQTGAYTFTLHKKLDHADPNDPRDVIDLVFGVRITDFDGDKATANIVISVVDDGPVINYFPIITKPIENVDESALNTSAITETGTIVVDYQGEGPGTVGTTGSFTAGGSKPAGNLKSNGQDVTVTHNNGTYTGIAGGKEIFKLTVASNGTYTFRLFEQLDHANGSDPNDVITLNFGINAKDSQGDTTTGVLTVNVADDAPLAVRDDCTIFIHEGRYTSNLITNDKVGQDTPGRITNVVGLTSVAVAASGDTVVQGQYGTLTLKSDGSYTYVLKAGVGHGSVDVFTYTLKDYDGDSSTANLTVSILANFNGTNAVDVMHGSANADTMIGNGGDDWLYGAGGDDLIYGGVGKDKLFGESGNDTIYGGDANDELYGGDGNDTLRGDDGHDYIEGGAGNDTIYGDAGDDVLYGGLGADTIYGGAGNDDIIGGAGIDNLYGGAGADTFWFVNTNEGVDRIKDFSLAQGDKLELSNVISNFNSVQHSINQFVFAKHEGGNTIISVNNNDGKGEFTLAVLENVTLTIDQLKNNIID
jgi:T1SS-143 domain-containing protein